MRFLYYFGWLLFMLLEIALVYFIMPMPGSQTMNSLPLAYFLYCWRWPLRLLVLGLTTYAWRKLPRKIHWTVALPLLPAAVVCYLFNGPMSASVMFKEPRILKMKKAAANTVPGNKLVLGVLLNGQAAAYPIQYIAYHHRVADTLGGKALWVTYCSVCRSGRVFEPLVNGKPSKFRLVGMDHFNAMFEDELSGSWWRQVNGEAVAGPLSGSSLPEIPAVQMSLAEWLRLHPDSKVMQPDPYSTKYYERLSQYETGGSKSALTCSDTADWQSKSWVAGVVWKGTSRAYNWKQLQKATLINDTLAGTHIALLLWGKGQNLSAWQVSGQAELVGDSIRCAGKRYDLAGRGAQGKLKAIPVYQEFWHSWKEFHPKTSRH
ncbi:MAG: DUF3179 domain-containing protein [Bacteroidetes bacterium]|nr:DUF3179 domain-containing protein [Bacteroidota bacterium]